MASNQVIGNKYRKLPLTASYDLYEHFAALKSLVACTDITDYNDY